MSRYEWIGYNVSAGIRYGPTMSLNRYPAFLWRTFFTADEVQEYAERERQKERTEEVLMRVMER